MTLWLLVMVGWLQKNENQESSKKKSGNELPDSFPIYFLTHKTRILKLVAWNKLIFVQWIDISMIYRVYQQVLDGVLNLSFEWVWTLRLCQTCNGMSYFSGYVKLFRVCQTFKGMSYLYWYVILSMVCHTCNGMSYL